MSAFFETDSLRLHTMPVDDWLCAYSEFDEDREMLLECVKQAVLYVHFHPHFSDACVKLPGCKEHAVELYTDLWGQSPLAN